MSCNAFTGAPRYTFIIEQGSTTNFEVRYLDDSSNPIDLSGYQARMQLRPTVDSDTILLSLSSSLRPDGTGLNLSGSTGTMPLASGSIGVYISAATSSALTFSEAVYDLEISNATTVTRLLQGKIKLSREVTR
jgi:hypothetical protein